MRPGSALACPRRTGIAGLMVTLGAEARDWLMAMPLFWRNGNMVAAHAVMDPVLPLEQQEEGALLWGHPDFGRRLRPDGLWVARGHVVTARAECMLLDIGVYATGWLSYALIDPVLPPAERLPLGVVAC